MSVCLSAACLYISVYTPVRSPVCHTSVFCRQSTPLNISAIFTARRICIARTMPWQHVCPTARPSVYLTLRPSIIRQASRPAHMNFCLFLYLYSSTPAYPSHSYAQCLPYMSVFVTFVRHPLNTCLCV